MEPKLIRRKESCPVLIFSYFYWEIFLKYASKIMISSKTLSAIFSLMRIVFKFVEEFSTAYIRIGLHRKNERNYYDA